MKRDYLKVLALSLAAAGCLSYAGCAGHHTKSHKSYGGPPYGPAHDRPFPLGQATDAHWETQMANAEAADFTFYDHEFRYDTQRHVDTAELSPAAKKHLEFVALRLETVPFPIVIEELPRSHDKAKNHAKAQLELARRQTIVEHLNKMGITNADERVVVANAFAEGFTGIEGERSYGAVIGGSFGGGAGRRFGGMGGAYR